MLISYKIIVAVMALAVIVPVAITWRRGSFIAICLSTWGSMFICGVFVDLAGPLIAKWAGEENQYRLPELPAWLGMAVFGLGYGLLAGGFVWLIRYARTRKGRAP
jgi:hypothetical protein